MLRPYGGIGAVGRDQQISARFLADEIKQLQATGLIMPSIFMMVAAFLLNIVLSRRIGTERTVIAVLKAFGYSNIEIAWHYTKSSLIVASLGSIAGAIAGNWMASGLASMYSEFYRFPTFVYRSDPRCNLARHRCKPGRGDRRIVSRRPSSGSLAAGRGDAAAVTTGVSPLDA